MDRLVEKTVKSLQHNGFHVLHAQSISQARSLILDAIPVGATVGVGDSVSVRQLDVLPKLADTGRLVVDPFSEIITRLSSQKEITEDQRWVMHKKAVDCEFFITGSNVVTMDGKLVNTDGGGNRVAGMIFGPKQVIIVAGTNKIVANVEDGLWRLKNIIAPELARIKGFHSPCVEVGHCVDCHGRERICNVTTILERAPAYTPTTVVLVDKDLGLSWDESWPQGRKEEIAAACDELTWLRRRPKQ